MPSPFLDTIPPEVREIIYEHVFGPSEAITPTTWLKQKLLAQRGSRNRDSQKIKDEERSLLSRGIQTDILTTNKKIYKEAIKVLYETRVVRGSVARMRELLEPRNAGFWNHVKGVEISKCNEEDSCIRLLTTLHMLQGPPCILSTVILSDCLTKVNPENNDPADIGQTVSEFAESARLGPLNCIEIGVYRLQDILPKVRIINLQLVNMWPAVRSTPTGYDGLVDAKARINSLGASIFGHNVPVWASQTSLRCWVDIQEQFLRLLRSGKWAVLVQKASAGTLDSATNEVNTHHFFSKLLDATRLPISTFPLLGSGNHVLNDLRRCHPSELLTEATEFLACNIAGYKRLSCHVTEQPEFLLRPVNWSADQNNQTELSNMFTCQSTALAGGAHPSRLCGFNREFVLDPILQLTPNQNNLIDRHKATSWLLHPRHLFNHIGRSADLDDPKRFTNLTHLFMALQPYVIMAPDVPGRYYSRRESWAHHLLTRTIYADQHPMSASDSERLLYLRITSVRDLRTVVWTVIELLARTDHESRAFVQSFRRDARAPGRFPDEIDAYLGWTYGKLLTAAAERLLLAGRVNETLAAQWVRDGGGWG